jgi:hypothetical protein
MTVEEVNFVEVWRLRITKASGRLADAGATFSPIATARCAVTSDSERRVKAKGLCSLVPDGRGAALCAPLASAQARANCDNVGQGGRLSDWYDLDALSAISEHGPGRSQCPTREGRDHSHPKASRPQ